MSDENVKSNSNRDEDRFPDRIAAHSKCLPHNEYGEVDVASYNQLLKALADNDFAAMEAISVPGKIKIRNAFSGLAKIITGPDPTPLDTPPSPCFDSDERAAEMVELYWMALARDVNFDHYKEDGIVNAAIAELNKMKDYHGNRGTEGAVTGNNVFRGPTSGDLVGPYISQFLLHDVPYGPVTMPQRINTSLPGQEYMATYDDWLHVQNSMPEGRKVEPNTFDPVARYPRNGRDLGRLVAHDFATYPSNNAILLLSNRFKCKLDDTNPYVGSKSQVGFVTFGYAEIFHAEGIVLDSAYRRTYYDRWLVHRTIRPELFAGRVHNKVLGIRDYALSSQVLNSEAARRTHEKQNCYMISQSTNAGCPCHPSYPGGHGISGGTSITLIKAFIDEDHVIDNPVVSSEDGTTLTPYKGPDLTVGNELDKLASNIAIGKQFSAAHWLSDTTVGMAHGEQIAIDILKILKETYAEPFEGFKLTKFNGEKITI